MRYAQLVVGPAGSGKSTYCSMMKKHGEAINRLIDVVNLDPAAEDFSYEPITDIRDLVSVDDAQDAWDTQLGPNGGLMFCMEYLVDHLEWLHEAIGEVEDDYILFDCPGQIELYTHSTVMKSIVRALEQWNFRICAVFLLDTQFVIDVSKFFSGALVALSTMVRVEVPCVNVMTKCDLLTVEQKEKLEEWMEPNAATMLATAGRYDFHVDANKSSKRHKLTKTIASILDDYSLIRFALLDATDEDSVTELLTTIDTCTQYGEDQDVKDRYPDAMEDAETSIGHTTGNGLNKI